jgi:hypothetical protein
MLNQPSLTIRVTLAAPLMLGLDENPPDREAEDYKAALADKFHVSR